MTQQHTHHPGATTAPLPNGDGVIRVARKGLKKFAFGDDAPFELDVVAAFQHWVGVDDGFRLNADPEDRVIATDKMPEYHRAAVGFAQWCASQVRPGSERSQALLGITIAEALDFIARLRECYDELVDFFQPRSRRKPESPDTSAPGLRFSVEGEDTSPPLT